jgi:uncharacterized protein (DUF1501 family)
MKRRDFLQYTGLTSASMLVPGFLKSFDLSGIQLSGKRLVIVQLSGGNDGLNSLVPFQNDLYYSARPKIAVSKNDVLKIADHAGFHPALSGFRKLYDQGMMAVYNGVGYPNPDRSHFRSMDIWHTASNSDEYLNTGWIGRLLDSNCPGSENSWYAMEVDDTLSLSMKGQNKSGFAVKDPAKLKQILNDPFYANLALDEQIKSSNSEIAFLYKTMASTRAGADYILEKNSQKLSSNSDYPQHEFGKSLQQIATLINNGIGSRIFYSGISGFDTHIRQAESQPRLLQIVGDSIYQLCSNLKAAGNMNDTVIMVFSEFGRRVKQNASNGTDHGTANQVYIIGGDLRNAGIRNEMSDLSKLDDGDLIHTMDFRRIYATLLDKVIGVNSSEILQYKFETLDIL